MGPCTKVVFVCTQWINLRWSSDFQRNKNCCIPGRKKEVVNLAHEGHQGVHGNRNINPIKPFYFPDQGDGAGIEEPEIATSTVLPAPEAEVQPLGVSMQPLAAHSEPLRVPVKRPKQPLAVRRSGRVGGRPKALDDGVLYWTRLSPSHYVTRNIVTEAISKGLRPKKRFFLCFKVGRNTFSYVFAVCTILGKTDLEYSVQWFSVTQIRGMLKWESAQEVLLLSVVTVLVTGDELRQRGHTNYTNRKPTYEKTNTPLLKPNNWINLKLNKCFQMHKYRLTWTSMEAYYVTEKIMIVLKTIST